jgi:diacylglycerol O-acyltransferase / wax synthase
VLSYGGGLYFGFTGCADKVPHLQRLAVYTGEAIDELEREFLRPAPVKVRRAGKTRAATGAGRKRAVKKKKTVAKA